MQSNETNEDFNRIFSESTRDLNNETLGVLPAMKNIRDLSTRSRNKRDNFDKISMHDIPLQLQKTNNNYQFMQFDSGVENEKRFIVFFSSEFLNYIQKIDVWIIDGTFKSVPKDFYQLITLQGLIFNQYIPLIFILTTDKTTDTYSNMLKYTIKTFNFVA
jgi:hypothetical protein